MIKWADEVNNVYLVLACDAAACTYYTDVWAKVQTCTARVLHAPDDFSWA
jgi:hypothetical protein